MTSTLSTIERASTMPDAASPTFEARDLCCRRGDRLLLTGLSFTLARGEILQITGANGVGKTTLLRMIANLTQPESGTLHWRGQPLEKLRSAYLRDLVYVGHADGVKGSLSVAENLTLASALHGGGIPINAALQRLGLGDLADTLTHRLSAGQRRRLALARLLVNQACLWLLDEPFTALDKTAIKTVASMLVEHAARGGLVIFTSHHSTDITISRALHLEDQREWNGD
ncbi:MAG: cytochrome c biogenesis heme-transporting ATPase CcmA [Gammaproteobacteria bacterium]